jgi:hypothetical protein
MFEAVRLTRTGHREIAIDHLIDARELYGTLNLCSVGRVQPGGWDKT